MSSTQLSSVFVGCNAINPPASFTLKRIFMNGRENLTFSLWITIHVNADEKNGADGNMQSMEFDLVFYPSIQLKSRSIRSKVAALSRFDCSFTLQFHISVVLHFIAKCTNSLMNCDPIWRLKQRFLLLQSKPLATIECEYQYSTSMATTFTVAFSKLFRRCPSLTTDVRVDTHVNTSVSCSTRF